mgnify:CR=1 FL=1
MENWRRFLNENKEQQVLSEEQLQQLEESLAGKSVATAALMFSISTAAQAGTIAGDVFTEPVDSETIADMISTLKNVKNAPSDEGPSDAAVDDVLDALTYVASLPDDQTVKRSDIQRFTAAGPLQLDSYESSQLFSNLTQMALAGELPVQVQGTYGADTGDTGAPDRIPGSSASSVTNYDKVLKVLSTSVSMGGSPERLNDLKAQAERYLDQAPDDKQQGFKDIIATIDSKLN